MSPLAQRGVDNDILRAILTCSFKKAQTSKTIQSKSLQSAQAAQILEDRVLKQHKFVQGASMILALCVLLAGCADKNSGDAGKQPPKRAAVQSDVLQFAALEQNAVTAVIATSLGDIKVVLYPNEAPQAVENFIGLAREGYYDNTIFHRVVKDFLIQGGDDTGTGSGGTTIWKGAPFPVEQSAKLHHYSGALSLAHAEGDTASNNSQFFIVQTPQNSVDKALAEKLTANGAPENVVKTYTQAGGAPYLDGDCTVFGQVYEGMDIVDRIAWANVDGEKPIEPITVTSITVQGGA